MPGQEQESLQKNRAPVAIEAEALQVERRQSAAAPAAQPEAAEETRQRQKSSSEMLQAAAQRELPAASAQEAAPGAPVQTQAPPKQSTKTRLRNYRHAKSAKRACPVGTAATYDMVSALKNQTARKASALQGQAERVRESGVDPQILLSLCTGYKVNRKGRAATPSDQKAQQDDEALIRDYCSLDVKRRAPHLDKLAEEIMRLQHSPALFSDRYVQEHIVELKEQSDRLSAMEKALADPINAPYFAQMEPVARELLEARVTALNAPFRNALNAVSQKMGVNLATAGYLGYNAKRVIDAGRNQSERLVQIDYSTAIGDLAAENQRIEARQAVRLKEAATDFTQKRAQRFAAQRALIHDPGLQLSRDEIYSEAFSRMAVFMGPQEKRAENLEALNTIAAVRRLQGAKPDMALHDRAKALLAPRIQKILDCDADWLLKLDGDALIARVPMLNDLATDAELVEELSAMEHPHANIAKFTYSPTDGYGTSPSSPVTMKEELTCERSAEYDMKLQIVRALAQKARVLALLREQRDGSLPSGTTLWLSDTKAAPSSAQELQREAQESERRLKAARETWQTRFVPGTQSAMDYSIALAKQASLSFLFEQHSLSDVMREFQFETSPEAAAVKTRLSKEYYYSLSVSQEELESRGMPFSIGEAIFRSYYPFAALEAAQTLLTPQSYRQMLLDLGAGHQMHKGEWVDVQNATTLGATKQSGTPDDQLEEAQKRNKRGLAQYKRVLMAQYDMMARKYGNSIEDLTLEDAMTHYAEMMKDIVDVQVNCNMVTRFPDFIDPNNPEDLLFRSRQLYFNSIGMALSSLLNSLPTSIHMSDPMQPLYMGVESVYDNPEFKEAIAYLDEHDPSFWHEIDWSQKVTGSPS